MSSRTRGSLAFVFFLMLAATRILAQQDQGVITGRVVDASGALLPGVTVTATALATGIATPVVTNQEGLYTIPGVSVGTYRVTAELTGFKRAVRESIDVHAQSRVRADFQLELGTLEESVTVVAASPLLETETSALTHVLKEAEIRELPLSGRNFQQLAVLTGGVLPAFGHRDEQGGFNSHGQWATQNNFILDGIDNNSQLLGMDDRKAQVLIPSLDAVQEYQIQTSNYSAEFGRSAGAVMNVTIKSGTNAAGGTAYEFLRNDIFDARDTFDYTDRDHDGKAEPPILRQNQFGFTIGGPVRRNRTFFFMSSEALLIHTTQTSLVTVPTMAERQGTFDPRAVVVKDPATGRLFPGNTIPPNRWDPVAARLVALWPLPNFAGSTRQNYVSEPPRFRDRYQHDVRIDHNFSTADKAFVRVSRMDMRDDRFGPLPAPAIGAPTGQTSYGRNTGTSVAASESHVFGAHLVNEARFGYNSPSIDKQPLVKDFVNERFGLHAGALEPVSGLARLTFGGAFGYVALGEGTFLPNYKISRTSQVLDNVSVLAGRHTIKAGADLRWIQSDIIGAPNTRGIFDFNGKFTGTSLGDFLLGLTNTRQSSTFQKGALRDRSYMFYAQDDWKATPRLTLNLGLRYELSSPTFDAFDRMTTLDMDAFPEVRVLRAGERGNSWSARALVDTQTGNWAPRAGFAYQPAQRWTLRGAAGVFYGLTGGVLGAASRLINNWPVYRAVTVRSTPVRSAGRLQDGIDASIVGDDTTMPPNLNWNVWARDFELPTIYQWNLGVQQQLAGALVLTAAYVGSSSNDLPRVYNINSAYIGDPRTERQRRPVPALGTINFREPSAQGSYQGLELTIDKRLSKGTQFSLAYTWSHSIDDVQELFGAESGIVQDVRNLRGDRGNSEFDRRHRLGLSYVVELPFGEGRRWLNGRGLSGALAGGWQLSGIASIQSGPYFDVTLPDATTFLGVTSSVWRADLMGDPYVSHPTPDRWLNRAAFAIPQNPDGTFRFGDLARNALKAPGYMDLDVGLMRYLRIGERRLQLRAEVFNVLNHPSYGYPNANLLSQDFGTIRSTVGTPRQMQFGLKFMF